MRIDIDKESLKAGQLEVILSHNDKMLQWNIPIFEKKLFNEDKTIFKYINAYWEHLPSYRQEKIFNMYVNIRNILEEMSDASVLIETLTPLIGLLYDEHKLEDIQHWMDFNTDIILPSKLDEHYVHSDEKPGNREKTYIKSDYRALLTMSISLRIMIPIWGEFIYRTKKAHGTRFKEFFAFQLLSGSHLMHSVPMEKLRIYINNIIQADKAINSFIIRDIGSEDLPIWLLSKILVNRLCVGDVSGSNQAYTLVTFIWNFIGQIVNNTNTGAYSSMVKNKEFESGESTNDHNASRLEGYKIKTELAIGDTTILEFYMNNPIKVALQLKPTINLALLNEFIQSSSALITEDIQTGQVTLVQYVMKKVLSPRGVMHLNKTQMISCIAITQTVLWEGGHKALACLMSATVAVNGNTMMLSGEPGRTRIPKEMLDELNTIYPFTKVSANKKKGKVTNAAIEAIDQLDKLFSKGDWILTLPGVYVAEVTGKETNRRYSCPQDIKSLLAKLIIELDNDIKV